MTSLCRRLISQCWFDVGPASYAGPTSNQHWDNVCRVWYLRLTTWSPRLYTLLCKVKKQYLLTCKVSRSILPWHGSMVLCASERSSDVMHETNAGWTLTHSPRRWHNSAQTVSIIVPCPVSLYSHYDESQTLISNNVCVIYCCNCDVSACNL